MKENKYTEEDLRKMQAFPLDRKVLIAQTRIIEWITKNKGEVFVSFSGGKDSTVLLNMVRQVNPDIPAVFANTGLEFPEIRKFANSFDNVIEIRPEMTFGNVLKTYGFPLISKEISKAINLARKEVAGSRSRRCLSNMCYYTSSHGTVEPSNFNCEKYRELAYLPIKISQECCVVMKERPVHKWQTKNKKLPFLGTMASESSRRKRAWLQLGCNAFDADKPRSLPLSIWTEQDVLRYILENNIDICSVYGDIVPVFSKTKKDAEQSPCLRCTGRQRTGCVFCLYGAHISGLGGKNRLTSLAETHPRLYEYCMGGGEWIDNPDYDKSMSKYNKIDEWWLNWNPKKIWVPNRKGLGYKVMLDMVNSIYGKDFIPYE